jgi:hypothetical protein
VIVPLLLLALNAPPACDASPASRPETGAAVTRAVPADTMLAALYAGGQDFESFLGEARARRAMWLQHWAQSAVPADVLARAQAIPGRWRLLVVAVDSCSDSVNTIPFLARLVSLVPSLEMRVVLPGLGKPVMEAHRTPDDRPATPTVVVLDAEGRDVGCWVERPQALQEMALKARAAGTSGAFLRDKQQWYDADAGSSTVREVVEVLEAAAAGAPRCWRGGGPLP